MDERAKAILQQHSQLKSDRAVFESHWQEIAERVLPRQDDFTSKNITQGRKNTEKIFDATAPLALDRAASAIDSLLTPATSQYHMLSPEDEDLSEDVEVMRWCEQVNKLLFRLRYRPSANFQAQNHENFISLMAFGTLGMFVDDLLGIGIRYKSIALSELFIAENHVGVVDYIHRCFPMTARQVVQKWGDKAPPKIKGALEKSPFQQFEMLHCVKPNEDIKHGVKDYRGMPYSSYYIACEEGMTLGEGGYRTMPYQVSRHVTAPRETYGRSPAMMVLADIKMVNEMEKTTIRAAHKIVDPPLLIYGDGALSAFNARPNALNYGGVDDQGRQMVHPLKTGANIPIVLEMTEQKRRVINDAFYVTLFQILVQNPQMTATEALIRAQEKGQLLAPTVGRQQSEYLGPMIERELDIASMAGILPPMPMKLAKAGGSVKIVYTSPLTRLRRAEDGVAISRTLEQLTPISQVDPSVFDVFDLDALPREISDINGVPKSVLLSPEAVLAKKAKRAENEQATIDAKNAQVAANAAKNLAQGAQAAGFTQPATEPYPS